MRRTLETIRKRDTRPCKYCGAEIVWRQYKSGGWYPTDVHYNDGSRFVVTGAGNHYNLKPRHDCRAEAFAPSAQFVTPQNKPNQTQYDNQI